MADFVLSGQELFGRYARIAYGHALDGKQDYHIYKCIRSFMSNCYCDVPLTYQTENNCHTHDNIVEVVNVIHCGIDENRVIRVARNDIELLPATDVEPVQEWIPVTERFPDEHESLFARYKGTDKWRNAMFTTISDLVIVCAEYENGERIVKTANTIDGNWKVKDSFYPCRVTHWMPLPKPPKGE